MRRALSANAPTPAATSDAPRALPFVGPGAPAPADRSSLAEEEWNFSRPGNATGGAGKAAAGASAAPARPEKRAASSSPGGGAAVLRSPGAVKAGLATGSQAAVVKLASYGAGSVRAGALMNYQSHKGELALEREDGTLVFGKQAVGDLAAQWRDEADGREPSNDVLSFTLTFLGNGDPGACSGSPWRRAKRSCLRMANGGDPNSCGDRRRQRGARARAASWSGFTPTRNRSLAFTTGSTAP